MADEELVDARRAWTSDPTDRAAQERYLALLRRAGEPGGEPALLEGLAGAARSFRAPFEGTVYAELPSCEVVRVGTLAAGEALEVPEHLAWWIHPSGTPALGELIAGLRGEEVAGLALTGAELDDAALGELQELPRLTWLSLRQARGFGHEGIRALAEGLPGLRHLGLDAHEDRLGRATVEALRGFPELIHLSTRFRLTSKAEHLVEALPRLTRLAVGGKKLDNAALAELVRLPELRQLELSSTGRVTQKGIEALAACASLTHLFVLRCGRVEKKCLDLIGSLPGLRTLGYLPVGRGGLSRDVTADDVKRLKQARGLKELRLPVDGLSSAQLAELRAALPGCRVQVLRVEFPATEPQLDPWFVPAAEPTVDAPPPPPEVAPAKADLLGLWLNAASRDTYRDLFAGLSAWAGAQTALPARAGWFPHRTEAWPVFLVAPAWAHAWAACPWLEPGQRELLTGLIRRWAESELPGHAFRLRRFAVEERAPRTEPRLRGAALELRRPGLGPYSPDSIDLLERVGAEGVELDLDPSRLRADVELRCAWGRAEALRFLELAAEREPPAFDPEVPRELAKRTDLDRAQACLVWSAFHDVRELTRKNFLPKEARRLFQLKVAEADAARQALIYLVPSEQQVAVAAAAVPDDPEQLWTPLADPEEGPVARLARAWNALVTL